MDARTAQARLERIITAFAEAGVEFIVIGGQAEVLHGSARVTYDSDLCYRRTHENFAKIAPILRSFHATLRGAPSDLPITIDDRFLQSGSNFTFNSDVGPLDLLGYVEPLGEFEALLPAAEEYTVADVRVKAIGLDDLIRIKQHINRPKDRDSLMHLLAIKQVRDEMERDRREGQAH